MKFDLSEHRSALRSTSRLGLAGVPNAQNLLLNLLRLLEVALVLASWRGRVALQSEEFPFFTALGLLCAWVSNFVSQSRETP